jgi:hypothetical protein
MCPFFRWRPECWNFWDNDLARVIESGLIPGAHAEHPPPVTLIPPAIKIGGPVAVVGEGTVGVCPNTKHQILRGVHPERSTRRAQDDSLDRLSTYREPRNKHLLYD